MNTVRNDFSVLERINKLKFIGNEQGKVFKLKSEIGLPTLLNDRRIRKTKPFGEETMMKTQTARSCKKDPPPTMLEMINLKRKILLKKINQNDRRDQILNMEKFMEYKESQLIMRIGDFKENSNLIKNNFAKIKEKVAEIETQLNYREDLSEDKTKVFKNLQSKIAEKEAEVRVLSERLDELFVYRQFTKDIFKESANDNEKIDEKEQFCLNEIDGFNSKQNKISARNETHESKMSFKKKNSNAAKNVQFDPTKNTEKKKTFAEIFMTSGRQAEIGNSFCGKSFDHDLENHRIFLQCLGRIEGNNFNLFEFMQDQEIKLENREKLSAFQEKDVFKHYQQINSTYNKIINEEKNLLKEKGQKEMLLKTFNGKDSKIPINKQLSQKIYKDFFVISSEADMNKIKQMCLRILANLGFDSDCDQKSVDSMKMIELIWKITWLKADIVYSANRNVFNKLCKEYMILTKKDNSQIKESKQSFLSKIIEKKAEKAKRFIELRKTTRKVVVKSVSVNHMTHRTFQTSVLKQTDDQKYF